MSTVVLASAGTGKTWILVDAWLRAALGVSPSIGDAGDAGDAHASPERLWAITFTEKAATEMRARVAQRLAVLRFSPAEEPHLRAGIADRFANDADRDAWLDGLRRAVGRAPIGTFHALCARLLREHALAAGLDPGFAVLEPDEERRLLHELGEGVVLDALAEGDAVVADLVARLPLRGLFQQKGLVESLVEVHGALAERGLDPAGLTPATPALDVDDAVAALVAARDALAATVEASATKAVRASVPPRLIKLRLHLERVMTLRAGPAGGDRDGDVANAFLELQKDLAGAWGGPTLTEQRRALLDAVAGLGAALVDEDARDLAPAVRELLVTLDERQRREKDLRGLLGFGDLLVRCRDLLRDDVSVRTRVKARVARVFVDEYQDTSPVQEQILAMLVEAPTHSAPLVSGAPLSAIRLPPGRLFLVGDPKQSIYGFRGADASVFTRAHDAVVARDGRVVPLTVSRRASAAVCGLANLVVRGALPDHEQETLLAMPERQATLSSTTAHGGRAGAWWRIAPPLSALALPTIEREAAVVAERLLTDVLAAVHDGGLGALPGQVLVLTRRSRSTAVIGRALSRRGIPVRVVGGDGFWRRPEITDVVSALSLVTDPRDELAALAVLRSPLVGLQDDAILALFEALPTLRDGFSWARIVEAADDAVVPRDAADRIRSFDALLLTLRARLATTPISTLIDVIVDDGGYAIACAAERDVELRLRHLEKLRGIAARGGDTGVLAIARLVDAVDDPPPEPIAFDADVGSDAVRIMTVHQSKGLEADVVVLADAGIAMKSSADDIAFDVDVGLAVSSRSRPLARCTPKASASSPSTIQRVRRARRTRDETELARLLYVAVTRARERLFVVGAPRRSGPSSMLGLLEHCRVRDGDAFDALLPGIDVGDVGAAPAFTPVQNAGRQADSTTTIIDDALADAPALARTILRVRASTLLAQATPQLAIGLHGGGDGDLHDEDVIPPRARGRLAHAIIGLVATELPHALHDEDEARAAIAAAEHALGSPPGAVDEALRTRILATLRGPLLALHQEGRHFESEVPAVLVVAGHEGAGGVVVEGTADLVATGDRDVIVVELKLSAAQARSEATQIQVLACCAGLEQRGLTLPLRAAAWAIGEAEPPAPLPWGKVARRHLATVLARVGAA